MKIVLLILFIGAKFKNSFVHARVDLDASKASPELFKVQTQSKTTIDKAILRYGFQQTRECKDYEKAYTCIRKCLDLGYQISYADKHCSCKCKHSAVIAKYKTPHFGPTKWITGAPTTSAPYWVKKFTTTKLLNKNIKPLDNFEVYGDISVAPKQNSNVNLKADKNSNKKDGNNGTSAYAGQIKTASNQADSGANQTSAGTNGQAADDGVPLSNETNTNDTVQSLSTNGTASNDTIASSNGNTNTTNTNENTNENTITNGTDTNSTTTN